MPGSIFDGFFQISQIFRTAQRKKKEQKSRRSKKPARSRKRGQNYCDVCRESTTDEHGPLMICANEKCGVVVHKFCYGVRRLIPGKWMCDPCRERIPNTNLTCSLCSVKGELHAFRKCTDGTWAHMLCGSYIPELFFTSVKRRRLEIEVKSLIRVRRKLRCIVCGTKNGACLQCSQSRCSQSWHVMCARNHNIDMVQLNITDRDRDTFSYCDIHQGGETEESLKPKKTNQTKTTRTLMGASRLHTTRTRMGDRTGPPSISGR
eukprot:484164_1